MTDMRHELIIQIDTLLDIANRHSWTKDEDERRYTIATIKHVNNAVAPYRYNGPTKPNRAKFEPWNSWRERIRQWQAKG